MELWAQIKNEDWALVAESGIMSAWTARLWSFEKHYQSLGGSGGAGVGYGAPAAVGAALANKKRGRLSVTIQGDGDFLYAPGVWWTAAHHRIPLLAVMHNNRAYHQELMHLQRMANRHQRGITRAHIGTTIDNPNVDFAKIAQGMGVHAQGPIVESERSRPGDQARHRGRQARRAVAHRRRDAAAVRGVEMRPFLIAFAIVASVAAQSQAPQQACRAAGQHRRGQEALRQRRLLSVPRVRGPRLQCNGPTARTAPNRLRGVQQVRQAANGPDATVHREGHHGCGPRRHVRLRPITA